MLNKHQNQYLSQEPLFDDIACSLRTVSRQPNGIEKEMQAVMALTRKFSEEVVRPNLLAIEEKMMADPDYVPWEWVEKANEWGFYTLWIPKILGGKGYCMPSMSVFCEELSSVCVGMANLIGVHYLGIATLLSTWNIPVIREIVGDVVKGEKTGRPVLVSLAITEPSAGTDVEEALLLKKGKISCIADKVEGGYRLSGSKVFISNAVVSKWHIIVAYESMDKPADSGIVLAVPNGAEGFSFGRKERKMGQMLSPASELVFDNCFVPDKHICMNKEQFKGLCPTYVDAYQRMVDTVTSVTRAAVCGFATGVARGAYEDALRYARENSINGRRLITFEWVQCRLVELYKNVTLSRLLYTEANYSNGLDGFFKLLQIKPIYWMLRWTPIFIARFLGLTSLWSKPLTRFLRWYNYSHQTPEEVDRTSGWSAMAKFVGSDYGLENCQLAMELMGSTGLRHDSQVEKRLRDSKLLQIYEGTNQLNRLSVFKHLINRGDSKVEMFDD